MSDLDNAINSINASAAKAENTAGFLDDMSTFDDQSSVTNPNNGQTVASIPKQVKDRTDELFTAAESDINQAVADAEQSATDAQDAADSIGRYQGLWPDTGGNADKGDTYQTQVSGTPTGQYFTALQDTTVDPVGDDVNWRGVIGAGNIRQYTDALIGAVSYPTSGSISVGDSIPAGVTHVWVQGGIYPLYAKDGSGNTESPAGTVTTLDIISPVPNVTIGTDEFWLLDVKWFKGVPSYKSFWAKGNAQGLSSDVSDYESMQACTDSVPDGGVLYKESGKYATHRKVYRGEMSRITIKGDGKFSTEVIPHQLFDSLLYDSLLEYGDGTNNANNVTLTKFASQAVYGSRGNDASGCTLNIGYNADIDDCQFKSGNPVTKLTGGLRLKNGKHTKIYRTNLHNGYGPGMVIDQHNVDLVIGEGTAFDETPSAIVSQGNIVEMTVSLTSFGNCVANPTYPTDSDGITIDLRVGSHTSIKIINGNTLRGSAFNKYGVRGVAISKFIVSGNELIGFPRYAIASEGNASEDFSDNVFEGNGTEGTSSNPADGTNDPETSPYTCDIFKLRAEEGGSKVCGNITDITDRPFAWIRGDSVTPYLTKLQVNSNNSDAYIHSKTYSNLRDFKDGYQDLQALPPFVKTIAGFTIASGSDQASNLTGITGAEVGDSVQINTSNNGLSPFLSIRGDCIADNIVRYYVTNPSASSVTQADFDVTIQVTKN